MDEIQRKLESIDRQLAGARGVHKRLVSTCPQVFLAVGCAAGVVIQNALDSPTRVWMILTVVFAAFGAASYIIFCCWNSTRRAVHPEITAYLALVCFVGLGAIRLVGFRHAPANDIRNFIDDAPTLATIRGVIVSTPRINRNRQWEFARFTHSDPRSSFYLKAEAVETVDGWAEVAGMVRVQVDEPVLDLGAGDRVRIFCSLDTFDVPANPGQFDTKEYLARRNVFVGASVELRESIKLLEKDFSQTFTKIKGKLRQTATEALVSDLPGDSPSEGLLEALLLGYRGKIDSDTYEAFRSTGLLHFISLSGLHLGILVGLMWWLSKTAGLMKPGRAIVCISVIVVFLLIVPPRAPTLRAAIIGIVLCLSFIFRRHARPFNTLALAATITLLIRPTQLFEAGWQLSFASVMGILFFTKPIERFFRRYSNFVLRRWEDENSASTLRILAKLFRMATDLFSIGLGAWLGGAGILLYHFYTINPLASLWTVMVFPLVASVLILGYLKMILSFLFPTVATVTGILATTLIELLIRMVKLAAGPNISEILVGSMPVGLVVLYYVFVVFAAFTSFRRPLIRKLILATVLSVVVVFVGVTKWRRNHQDDLVVTCLAVGHGQAIVVQLPGGQNVLFDAGSLFANDVGGRIVNPFLDYSGISRIDAIVISHNDVDHINGILEVAKHRRVNGIYADEAFINGEDRWKTAEFLKKRLTENGLQVEALEKLSLKSGASVGILWPDADASRDRSLGDNDKSVVSLIEFGGVGMLLCSDIEKFAQGRILRRYPDLKAEVVVVPHHGSRKSLDENFLHSLDAEILICSCSRRQYERQRKSPRHTKAPTFYTPETGAVTVRIDKHANIELRTGENLSLNTVRNDSPPPSTE